MKAVSLFDAVPVDEIWLLEQGVKTSIHVHEGSSAGMDAEIWVRGFKSGRIINMGDIMKWPEPKEFILPCTEGDKK